MLSPPALPPRLLGLSQVLAKHLTKQPIDTRTRKNKKRKLIFWKLSKYVHFLNETYAQTNKSCKWMDGMRDGGWADGWMGDWMGGLLLFRQTSALRGLSYFLDKNDCDIQA